MAKKKGIPGLSFSWKRALGVTSAKRKWAKFTGVPTTKSGRRSKLGRMLGITVEENFNRPYFSKGIAEYWRRWHMTLDRKSVV